MIPLYSIIKTGAENFGSRFYYDFICVCYQPFAALAAAPRAARVN